ncbi:MAG: hypothetical protein JWN79_455, partial [Gemmatimonadetes bacterium]|nr:hypothetical protein [Gemmatimonadota bacterium]
MTSARRTPRYVGVISSEPMGPQLMGPHPAAPLAESALPAPVPSAAPSRRSSSGILPLHRDQANRYTPASDRAGIPAARPAAPLAIAPASEQARSRPRPVVPVERRPWRVLIVSAAPAVLPRSFEVARWQARSAIVVLALTATLAMGFVASVVVAIRAPELFGERSEVRALRSELASTRDSLALARASIAESVAEESGDADSTPA